MYIDNLELARSKLNLKQQRFCEYYVACGNVYEAGLKAGYSDFYSNKRLHTQMKQEHYQNYIKELTKPLQDKRIADIQEIRQFWTDVVRNEDEDMKDRLKASEYIAKTNGAFIDKIDVNANVKKINPLDGLTTEELKRLANGSD